MRCYFEELTPHSPGGVLYKGVKDGCPVFACEICGLVFCPKTDPEEYLRIYKEPKRYFDVSVSVGYSGFIDRFRHDYGIAEVRVRNLDLRRRQGEGVVLDVGCGNGALLKRLSESGLEAWGVDLDEWSVHQATHQMGDQEVHVAVSDFLDFDPGRLFDVVMFTDSFEHFLYPHSCAQKAVDLLRRGGLIVIEMPDTNSDGWRCDQLQWRHVKPLEHPFLYSSHHISDLFRDLGWKIVDTVVTIPGRVINYLRRGR